jgi:hypothetical protein
MKPRHNITKILKNTKDKENILRFFKKVDYQKERSYIGNKQLRARVDAEEVEYYCKHLEGK